MVSVWGLVVNLDNAGPKGLPDFDADDVISHEVIEHAKATNYWTAARRIALQVLYEVDSARHPVGEVIDMHLSYHDLNPKAVKFLRKLVLGVLESHERLDRVIQHFAPEWPLSQVAIIDRNILRLAIYEFAIAERTPVKVAIDEAVQLARLFGAEGSPRFVNGVLGALVDDPTTLHQMLGADDEGASEKTGEESES